MRATIVGWSNARFGEIRTMQIGTISLLLGLALMPLPASLLTPARAMPLFILFLIVVPMGTALLFPVSTSLVSPRTDHHELGLVMWAHQTFRGIMRIVGAVSFPLASATLAH